MNGLSEGALGLLALGLLEIYIYVICYVIRCKKCPCTIPRQITQHMLPMATGLNGLYYNC